MLDRTGNADGDIQVRSDDFTRLPNLHFVRGIACVDRSTRRADPGAHRVRKLVDDLEILFAAQRAAAGDHDRRRLQVGAIGFCRQDLDKPRMRRQFGSRRHGLDSGIAATTSRLVGRCPDGRDDRSVGVDFDGDDRVTGVYRPFEAVAAQYLHDITDLVDAQ